MSSIGNSTCLFSPILFSNQHPANRCSLPLFIASSGPVLLGASGLDPIPGLFNQFHVYTLIKLLFIHIYCALWSKNDLATRTGARRLSEMGTPGLSRPI